MSIYRASFRHKAKLKLLYRCIDMVYNVYNITLKIRQAESIKAAFNG